MVVGLVATPFLLRWLGEARFGAFRALSDCLGYLALLELGRGGALVPMLLRAMGQGNEVGVRKTLAAGFRGYGRTTLLMLVGEVLIFLLVPTIVPLSQGAWELRAAVLCSILGILCTPVVPTRLLLETSQRGYVVNLINIAQSLLVTSLSLAFAWRGFGIPGQSIASSIGVVAAALLIFVLGIKNYPGLIQALTGPVDAEAEGALRRLSWPTVLLQASSQVSVLSDNLVISAIMGPSLVVPFAVTQRLVGVVGMQIRGVSSATSAQLASLFFSGDVAAFRQRFLELLKLATILCFSAFGPVLAFNAQFVAKWLGPTRFGGEILSALACVAAFALVLMNLFDLMMGSTGHVRERVPLAAVSGVINIFASVGLTLQFKLWGPILGTLVALITVNAWWYPRLLNQIFGLTLGMLSKACVPTSLIGALFTTALWRWAHVHVCQSWIDMFAEMAGAGLLFLALAWVLLLTSTERDFWRARLRIQWNGKRK